MVVIVWPYGVLLALQVQPVFQHGDRLYTSESAVCRREIVTYEVVPCTEKIKYLYWYYRPMTYVFK